MISFISTQGKGTINTYFLNGKDDFTKSLPNLNDAAPISEHEFKYGEERSLVASVPQPASPRPRTDTVVPKEKLES